jgi:hypothetical protein
MAIADSVPAIFQNHGFRVRGGIGFSVNKGASSLYTLVWGGGPSCHIYKIMLETVQNFLITLHKFFLI